jgi:pimeloyl-ACP methyl ester carboxylesterase
MEFVLVHGAYHGAWCWDFLARHLEGLGHRVVAVDLPAGDPAAGIERCAEVVAVAARDLSSPIVVGHSMGGVLLPVVASMMQVAKLVFLAAWVPRPGLSMSDVRAQEQVDTPVEDLVDKTHLGEDVWTMGPATARSLFYSDVPTDVATWAVERLRPQAFTVMREPSPLGSWPDVPVESIVCGTDRTVNPEWSRDIARSQLGVRPIEIGGGHSPFLARPTELVDILIA